VSELKRGEHPSISGFGKAPPLELAAFPVAPPNRVLAREPGASAGPAAPCL
jgi:hypothetical protein